MVALQKLCPCPNPLDPCMQPYVEGVFVDVLLGLLNCGPWPCSEADTPAWGSCEDKAKAGRTAEGREPFPSGKRQESVCRSFRGTAAVLDLDSRFMQSYGRVVSVVSVLWL